MYRFLRAHVFSVIFILGISLWGLTPLMHAGLFTAHDIWHQVARLFHYSEALRDGQLFPAWVGTLAQGNGYPLFLFSYHFPWFFGAAFVLLGLSIPVSLKLLFGLSFALSGLAFYHLAYSFIPKKLPAAIAAAIYLVAPFHFLSIYVSASIGMTFFFLLLPWIFLGIHTIFEGKWVAGVAITALSIAAGVLTHLMSLVIFAPFIALYVLFELIRFALTHAQKRSLHVVLSFVTAGVIALCLAAYYALPLLKYLPETRAQDAGNGFSGLYAANLVTIKQLLYSPWGFGPIVSNAKDGEISLQLGIAQWLGALGALGLLLIGWFVKPIVDGKVLKKYGLTAAFLLLTFLITIVVMTDAGIGVWKLMSSIVSIDYPFRLLTLSVFLASLLAHFVLSAVKPKMLLWLGAAIFLGAAVYTNRNHVRVNLYTDIPIADYVQAETTTNTFHEYLPKAADSSLMGKEKQPPVVEKIPAENVITRTNLFAFSVSLPQEQQITLRQFGFPGQKVFVDATEKSYGLDTSGRIQIALPAGTHQVAVRYVPTPLMQVSTLISVISLFSLCISWYILEKRKI